MKQLITILSLFISLNLSSQNIYCTDTDVHLQVDGLNSTILIGTVERVHHMTLLGLDIDFVLRLHDEEVMYLYDDDGWGEEWDILTLTYIDGVVGIRHIGYAWDSNDRWMEFNFELVQEYNHEPTR